MERKVITIIGMPGSGKSTVGKLLAEALNLNFIDTDEEIEKETGLSIPEIFERMGEAHFRKIEKLIVRKCLERGEIISLGGGAILDPETRKTVFNNTLSFYIKIPLNELARRLKSAYSNRPLLKDGDLLKSLRKLYFKRKNIYESARYIIEGKG